MISIACLIYRSTRYADAVWNSLREFTPELDHSIRFFFVANDATSEVLNHLESKDYPFVVQENLNHGLEGYDPPEYIRRVYMGWNRAVRESDEIAVLVSSDFMFSQGWLDALLRHLTPNTIVSSQLVERRHPVHGVFPGAYENDFGDHPDRFRKHPFLEYAQNARRHDTRDGGAYGPWAFYRDRAIEAGLYPEGNPPGTYGDREFVERLRGIGVRHITALDSIVYHFKEGEMEEVEA